jgi:uncharacterized membrane protein
MFVRSLVESVGVRRFAAAIFCVLLAIFPFLVKARIPGCTAIAVWSETKSMTIPACIVEEPQGPELVVALNVYGTVIPVAVALAALAVVAARDKKALIWFAVATLLVGLIAYFTSSVDSEGRVMFRTAIIALLVSTAFLLAVVAKSTARRGWPSVTDLLAAFAFAFVAGVLGVLLADIGHMRGQMEGGTVFVHIGGGDTSDMIFEAGWVAVLLFSGALALRCAVPALRLSDRRDYGRRDV